jgi:hypothetical protein
MKNIRGMVGSVIGPHTLEAMDVLAECQRRYGKSPYIWINKKIDRLHDNICFAEEGLRKGKSLILLRGCPTIDFGIKSLASFWI